MNWPGNAEGCYNITTTKEAPSLIPDYPKIAFIGFGEAAQAFAQGLRDSTTSLNITGFDIKTDGPNAQQKRAEMAVLDVTPARTPTQCIHGADLIISLVTADQSETAASQLAEAAFEGALFFDGNSCAPETKRRTADIITAAGGRYVDVAIMAPVHPRLHKTPCLFSGTWAPDALQMALHLGMAAEIAGPDIGAASMRKMLRSIMIKGLEALTLECFLAARRAGQEPYVLASLEASFPGFNWAERAPYMLERAMTHGVRRAAEMREVAQTLRDLDLSADMATATANHQQTVGDLGLDASALDDQSLETMTDAILAALPQPKT
ncbi:DUF1932 domain-containing protein [Shimia sp.]|uniref:NAD(P)-dependent oxidoreductase n=1 Tax=Shimia sp. TaxID=1954381 RepID=UPI003296CA00